MKTLLIAATAALALSGCTGADGRAQREAEALITSQLSDPDSAKFDEAALVADGGALVCGHVNAKNLMGGYAGRSVYVVWRGQAYVAPASLGAEATACCELIASATDAKEATWQRPGFHESCSMVSNAAAMPFNFSQP